MCDDFQLLIVEFDQIGLTSQIPDQFGVIKRRAQIDIVDPQSSAHFLEHSGQPLSIVFLALGQSTKQQRCATACRFENLLVRLNPIPGNIFYNLILRAAVGLDMRAHDACLFVWQDIHKARIKTPLPESSNQFLPQKILPDSGNRIRRQAEFLQMIGNIDRSTTREKPARQAIPQDLTEAKDRGNGRISHRNQRISVFEILCKQPICSFI